MWQKPKETFSKHTYFPLSFHHLKTEFNPFYLKTQFVPRSKHISPRL